MTTPTPQPPVHLSIVLDRSGSMASIADDMVGGFNELLAEQRTQPGDVLVTLAQFDDHDPFELLIDAVPLREVLDLERTQYVPRGSTPLFDAIGRMIAKVDAEAAGSNDEGDQVVAIITDGLENASSEFTREAIFKLIEERRTAGWAFVFLGANQDSYATGERMAFAPSNRGNWEYSSEGSRKAMRDLSYSMRLHRSKPQSQRRLEADEFWSESPEDGEK